MGKNTVCITEQHICKQGKLLIHSVQVKDTITWCCLNISTALGLMEVKLCICLNRKRDKTKYGSKNIKKQNMHVHEGQIMAFMASFPCFNTLFIFTTMKSFVFSESCIFSGWAPTTQIQTKVCIITILFNIFLLLFATVDPTQLKTVYMGLHVYMNLMLPMNSLNRKNQAAICSDWWRWGDVDSGDS